jgi:pimeloyl-ACP methyl ester carboxylesterase
MGMELKSQDSQLGTVLLVHGAFHGAWCWKLVVEELEGMGIPVRTVDLPGHGESDLSLGGLGDDATVVRDMIRGCSGPIVLCGHSYGGVVISEAVEPESNVAHLVYVAAGVPDVGECMLDNMAGEDERGLSSVLRFPAPGVIEVDPVGAPGIFYNDCDEEIAAWAGSNLDEQLTCSLAEPATQAPWRGLDSTYIICSQDRVVPTSAQQNLAKRCSRSLVWNTSHSPMLSQPGRLASLLAELAGGTAS